MERDEKIEWLRLHVPEEYEKARAEADKELDAQTPMFCFCGSLATGFHTNHCRKFQKRLKARIIDKLKEILPSK